jgi:hypothetical protein
MPSHPRRALFALLAVLLLTAGLAAQDKSNRTRERVQWGGSITIAPEETVSEATCFGCSVYVQGTVNGDVVAFFGNIVITGDVRGDVTTFRGDVRLEDGGRIEGDLTAFSGRLVRSPQSSIGGETSIFESSAWIWSMILTSAGFIWLIAFMIVLLVRKTRRPVQQMA